MGERIRVLQIIGGLNSGGKERQLIECVKNLDKNKIVSGIITFNSNQHYSLLAKAESSYYYELRKRPTRLEPLFTIWRHFINFKPDLVHTWDSLSSFYAWLPCKYFGIPLVDGSIRDVAVDKGLNYIFKKFFLKQAKAICSNSSAGLQAYKVKGHVIYNSINLSRFLPHILQGEFNLIMIANFSKYKDHQTFLKAALELVKNDIIDNVYLLGDGPYKEKYNHWIKNNYPEILNRFHFQGVVRDVENYLAKCQVGVLCSTPKYSEGLSNSVLEYMAAGVVPIITNLGGSAEIINNGVNGFLIQPGDAPKIVELITYLKNDSDTHIKMINAAKQTVGEKFSMSKNLEKLCLLYNEIVIRK